MKYWLAGCALAFAACGDNANKSNGERVDVPVTVYGAYVVNSFDSVPECVSGNEGQVVYSIEADAYSLCTSTGYQQISLTAETSGKCKANHIQNGIHIFDCGDSAKYRLQEGSGCVHFDEDETSMLVCYDSSAVRIPKSLKSQEKCSVFKLIPGSPAVKCGNDGFAQIVWSGFDSKLTVVLTGSGSPSKDAGNEGDTYLDTTTGYVWIKQNGVWVLEIAKDASWACSVVDNADSTYSIKCPDGSSVTVKDGIQGVQGVQGLNGADGSSCTVKNFDQSSYSLACGKDTVIVPMGKDGLNGKDGTPCSVASDAEGVHKLSCPDETAITIINGLNGSDGKNGSDGQSCIGEIVANGIQISCGGEVVDVLTNGLDGLKGDDGKNGTSCLGNVIPEGVQIVCAGVPLDTLTSGVNGLNGESCSARTIVEGIEVTCGVSFKDTLINGVNGATGPQGESCSGRAVSNGIEVTCGGVVVGTVSNGTNGADGISIQWLGTLTAAPSTPSLNQAYYNSTDGISYIWDGESWEILAKDGASSSDLRFPDGISGDVVVSTNYTVPIGKTLYITSYSSNTLLVNNIAITSASGYLKDYTGCTPIIGAGLNVYVSNASGEVGAFSGFIVDEGVTSVVSQDYTVPSGKSLVITSIAYSLMVQSPTGNYFQALQSNYTSSSILLVPENYRVYQNSGTAGAAVGFSGYLIDK